MESTTQCKLFLATGIKWDEKWERFQQLLSEYKEMGTLCKFLSGSDLTEIQAKIYEYYILGRGNEWTLE